MKKLFIAGAVIMIILSIGYLLKGDIQGANISILATLCIFNSYAILEERGK